MWWSRRDNSRIDLGARQFPIRAVAIALAVVVGLIFALAYFNRTPYGSEISEPRETEMAVKEYLTKNERRTVGQMTFYNCSEFLDSIASGKQILAAAVELGPQRPVGSPDLLVNTSDEVSGNLLIVSAIKEGEGDWQIASIRIPNGKYDPAGLQAVESNHPCALRSLAK